MAADFPFSIDLNSLQFDQSLRSGNPDIDAEHEQLLHSAQDILYAASAGKPTREIQSRLDELVMAMSRHFAHEDQLMNQSGWSEAEQHAGIHRLLMAEATRLVEQHRATMASFLDIYRFVVGTLVRDHLATHDVEFHHYLQEQEGN